MLFQVPKQKLLAVAGAMLWIWNECQYAVTFFPVTFTADDEELDFLKSSLAKVTTSLV